MIVGVCSGVKFVIDGDDVLAMVGRRIDRLRGEKVKDILIPLLSRLQTDSLIELAEEGSVTAEVEELALQLVEGGYLKIENQVASPVDKFPEHIQLGHIRVVGLSGIAKIITDIAQKEYFDLSISETALDTLSTVTDTDDSFLTILVVEDDLSHTALKANRILVDNEQSFLVISLPNNSQTVEVGPFVTPGESACLECRKNRRLSNMTYAYEQGLFMDSKNIISGMNDVYPDYMRMSFCAAVILNLCKMIRLTKNKYTEIPYVEKKIAIRLDNLQVEETRFVRNPSCSTCGGAIINITPVKQWSSESFSS